MKTIRQIRLALSFVWKSSKSWTITRLFLMVLQAALPLATLYLWKLIIDFVSSGINNSEDIAFDNILWLIVLIGIVSLATSIVRILSQLANETQQQLVSDYMYGIIQSQAIKVDLAYFENPAYLDTFHKAQQEANYRPVKIYNSLTEIAQSTLSLLALGGLLISLHWAVALILLITTIPSAIVRTRFVNEHYRWQHRRVQIERWAKYLNSILTGVEKAKDLRIFGFGEYLKDKFKEVRRNLFEERFHIGKKRSWDDFFANSVEILAVTATYGFIAFRALKSIITLGDMVMYYQAFRQGRNNLNTGMQAAVRLYENRMFLDYLAQYLEINPSMTEPQNPVALPATIGEGITFENVSFRYPFTDRIVLHDLSMSFKKGEVSAIVGLNGAGKSTLIKLLCYLYEPTKGRITLDGVDLKKISPDTWRKRVSLASQNHNNYQFTVNESIQLGDVSRVIDNDSIRDLAECLDISDFIKHLPHNYDQLLGRKFDGGIGLSSGQWRKIALMRAFYKNAEIILLDEPTNVIDPLTEHKIFETIRKMAIEQHKLVVFVTHRLYNLDMVNQIFVLEKGRLCQSGTHKELIRTRGKYKTMFEKQKVVHQSEKLSHSATREGHQIK